MIVLCSMYGRIPGLLLLAHSESLWMEKITIISYLVVLFSLQIFQIPTIKIKTPDRPTLRFLSKTNLRSQHISIMEITLFGLLCTAVVHNIGTFLKLFSANAQCGLGLIISVEELILCYTFRIASQVGWLWMGSSSSL